MKVGLRLKLIVLYVLLATIPALALGLLSYQISYNALWNNTVHSTTQIADQLNKSIESLFTSSEQFIDIGNSDQVRDYISGQGDSYQNAKQILTLFDIYRKNFPFADSIENIYIFGTNGRAIIENRGVMSLDLFSDEAKRLLTRFQSNREVQIITGNINAANADPGKQYIYVGQTLSLPALREPFCTVLVELQTDAVDNFCRNVDIAGSGYFTIFDNSGEVIFGPAYKTEIDRQKIFSEAAGSSSGNFTGKLNGDEAFFIFNTSPRTNWKIVGQVKIVDLMQDANSIARTTFTAIGLILLFAIGLYLFFSSRLVKPLRNLKATMQIAALGDMSVRFKPSTGDEISDLGNSFNKMIGQIDMLAKQNLREQLSLRKSEFKLLQAQINPHFLYNTLDTILWLAKAERTTDVINMVDALSRFFRTTLSKGYDWISVQTEVNLVRDYLIIQKIRYAEILDFNIEIEADILQYPMLKLTLQPLVENALYHGIKNKRGGGRIVVKGWKNGEELVFIVDDNGAGMPKSQLASLTNELENQPNSIDVAGEGGYGLKNVNSRIKLYYGSRFGIRITSSEAVGTCVEVRLGLEGANV